MLYPSLTEYVEAIKNAEDNFDKLSTFVPVKDASGDPIFSSGNFAVVFQMRDQKDDQEYAVRCFIKDTFTIKGAISIDERIRILNEEIRKAKIPYFVDFKYLKKELFVDSSNADEEEQDVFLMEWIKGSSLKKYLLDNKHDKDKLIVLSVEFLQMCKSLRVNGFSHGDLQHDNIIVTTDHKLKLIDYDSLYCSKFGNSVSDLIEGYRDYQHPCRKDNNLSSVKIDYFSELVIYTSILAIAESPTLVERYKLTDKDGLLFSAKDFRDLKSSSIYADLYALGGLFPVLLQIFDEYLSHSDINDLEAFDIRYEELTAPPSIVSFTASRYEVYKGESVLLSWNVTRASKIYINDSGIDITDNSCKFVINGDMNFILKATNGLKTVVQELAIKVLPMCKIQATVTPKLLRQDKNESATLSWKVDYAKKVSVYSKNDNQELSSEKRGSISVCPSVTSTYVIDAIGLDGVRRVNKEFEVRVEKESTFLFKADKEFSMPSVPVTVEWDVKNATVVEIVGDCIDNNGVKEHKGSFVIEPKKDTKIGIRVTDVFGTKEDVIVIKMIPLPAIHGLFAPIPNINETVEVNVSLNPMKADVSLPHYSDIQSIPFVPTVEVPNISSTIEFHDTLVPGLDGQPVSRGWKSIVETSNTMFNNLKSKLSK